MTKREKPATLFALALDERQEPILKIQTHVPSRVPFGKIVAPNAMFPKLRVA